MGMRERWAPLFFIICRKAGACKGGCPYIDVHLLTAYISARLDQERRSRRRYSDLDWNDQRNREYLY
ncbi:hypothetical protein BSONL12_01312 [Bacillus sonorensis L12]|uniref:Uncharacterized protein n=2 Tax=Bacillus sonorensis TaxID=119858 RepID=M5PA67_9BACI|nr:hypothetical protein BSONL12_01312 [Bacillus sonorensis L12]